MNDLSRREILKLMAAAAAAELVVPWNLAASNPVSPSLTFGLYFGSEDLERMRRLFRDDPAFAGFREELLGLDLDTERHFVENEVEYNDQLFDLRNLARLVERVAFRALIADDEKAAELAIDAVRTILKFDRWDFYMEAGQTIGVQRASASTVSISLAADWLGERISADERSHWFEVMAERGCEACYRSLYGIRYPREVKGWYFDSTSSFYEYRPDHRTDLNRRPEITQETNLRAVPASALITGAIADQLQNGKNADNERWLEMGLFNVKAFGEIYEKDGSYNEGISYANYTSLHIAQATAILARHAGIDIRDLINWEGYVQYVLNMWMPTSEDPYDIVNFSDAGNPKPPGSGPIERTAVPAWVADTRQDKLAQWVGENATGTRDQWSLIWYDPSVEAAPPVEGPRLWINDLDWVVARTGFEIDDLVVAMRSGFPANHEHGDRNSIIVKCFGEQLVADPHRPPYLFADPSWRMRLTEGHSAVLIDGHGHEHHNGVEGTNASRSFARIVESLEGPGYSYWSSNATQPYRLVDLDIRSVIRDMVVLYDVPAVVVIDRVKKYDTPSTVEARFFGYNYDGNGTIVARSDGFVISRPGAVLRAHVMSNRAVMVESKNPAIPEEVAVRHPFAAVSTEADTDITLVTVLSIARPTEPTPAVSLAAGSGGGEVQIAGRRIQITPTSVTVE